MRSLELRRLLAATASVLVLLAAAPLSAATFLVNTTNDTHAVSFVTGLDSTGHVSLRSALEAADTQGGSNTVMVPTGTYDLTLGELAVGNATNTNTTITGTAPATGTVVRQTVAAFRVFDINALIDPGVSVTLQHLTIRGGRTPSDGFGGAGILAGGPTNVLTITDCVITDNIDTGAPGAGVSFTNGGLLTLTDSTVSNNMAPSAASGQGGGLYFESNGANPGGVSLLRTVVSGNQAGYLGAAGAGGGIWFNGTNASPPNLLSISKSAFVSNQAPAGAGGAIAKSIGQLAANLNRIVANTGASGSGVFLTGGGGTVSVEDNWWGCNAGPAANCPPVANGTNATVTSWLQLRHAASPNSIDVNQTSTLTADLLGRNSGGPLAPGTLMGLPPFPSSGGVFSNPVKGTLSLAATQFVDGQATATFTAGTVPGAGSADATADSQTVTAAISIMADSATSVISSANPSVSGQTVTFMATVMPVSPASSVPSGSVQFVIDGSNVGAPVVLDGLGHAQFATSTLTVAGSPHTVTANYLGGGGYRPSGGSLLGGQTVNKANTTAAITSDLPDPSVVGAPVTVAYTVTANAPGSGTPTGTVTVTDGTASCSATVAAGSCSLVLTGVGPHTLTATYGGDPNYNASPVSAGAPHTVNKADTTAAITSDLPDPSVVGQAVTVSYSVSVTAPGAGTPTGTVTVTDGTISCIGTLPATSCVLTFTSAGPRSLTATYGGDANFNASPASPAAPHTVNKADTTAAITSDLPDPSVVGQAVTVVYTVSVTPPGAGTPTGSVLVTDGTASCTGTLPATSCVITLTTAGTHSLTVTYQGDANFNVNPPSVPESHVVNKADTTVAITSDNPDPSSVGQAVAVTYVVSVSAPGGGTPAGLVTVTDGTDFCTGSVAAGTCNIFFSSPGAKTLVATYGGSADYNASPASAGVPHTVTQATTTTTITADTPDPSVTGQAVTVSYTVTPSGLGTPTGTVTVTDGVASCSATVAAGSCSLTLTLAGSRPLTATYGGDANFTGSTSAPAAHTVNKAATTAAIVSDVPDPSVVGEPVTVTYTVSVNAPGSGTPTGNVTVTDGTASCTGTIAAGSCVLTLTSAGAHTLTATYAGDANFLASPPSAGQPHTVLAAATTTTITSSVPNPSLPGQAVVFSYTVTVNAPGAGTPTGTVTVTDGVDSCTAPVAAGSCPITFTVPGPHVLTATYSGDANFTTSTSAPFIHNVAFPNNTAATAKDVFLGSTSSDLLGPAPADHNWFRYTVQAGRSYCVEVDNGKSDTSIRDSFLSVFQADGTTPIGSNDDVADEPGGSLLSRVCYIATANADNLADVSAGALNTPGGFRIRVVDTTVFSPWFFGGNGFDTFILVKNTTGAPHNVTVTLYSADGTPAAAPQSGVAPADGNYNLMVSEAPPVGFGVSSAAGGVLIAHDGPPGSLAASVLSVNFGMGVSFDTPAMPRQDFRR